MDCERLVGSIEVLVAEAIDLDVIGGESAMVEAIRIAVMCMTGQAYAHPDFTPEMDRRLMTA